VHVAYKHQLCVFAFPILDSIERYLGHNKPDSAPVLDMQNRLNRSKKMFYHLLQRCSASTVNQPLIAPASANLLESLAL
jgi:hypothetical protein